MDGVKFTLLGAQRTSDAAEVALGLDRRAPVVGVALHQMLCLIRYKLDQVLRAGCHALAAGHTFFLIYHSNAVHHMNRVKLAGFYAGTKAHAAVRAGFLTASRNYSGFFAVLDAIVLVLCSRMVAGSLALYERHHLFAGSGLHTHNRRDLRADGRASYRTGIDRGFSLGDCLGQAVATRITAAAAT